MDFFELSTTEHVSSAKKRLIYRLLDGVGGPSDDTLPESLDELDQDESVGVGTLLDRYPCPTANADMATSVHHAKIISLYARCCKPNNKRVREAIAASFTMDHILRTIAGAKCLPAIAGAEHGVATIPERRCDNWWEVR